MTTEVESSHPVHRRPFIEYDKTKSEIRLSSVPSTCEGSSHTEEIKKEKKHILTR